MRKVFHITQTICVYLFIILFIILFVYAAVSKLIDFENFKVQVAQSPLLSAFATAIAYAVVIGELIIAVLLCYSKTRTWGLYLFLGFMTAFTVYIYLILNYSPFVPCSCGGVLEKMGWTEHLWFNIVFCFLAIMCIISFKNKTSKIQIILLLGATILISTLIVVVLFLSSEHIMKKENPFVRRFLPHPITDVKGITLPYNSYYLAGYYNNQIYLGNYMAPLHGLISNTEPKITDTLTLQIPEFEKHRFSAIKWTLHKDSILLNDYTVPIFYNGLLKTKKMHPKKQNTSLAYSQAVPLNSNHYVIRTFNTNRNNVNLSLMNLSSQNTVQFNGILDEENKPTDLFSNDGILLYNKELNKIIYVFYYKNKSLVFDNTLQNKNVLQTIDTITTPNFKVEYLEKKKQLKMNTNAIKVHKTAATAGNYLFVASDRIGKNERKEMYDQATIIDVYDLRNATYTYSFYFYHHENTPVTQFQIYHNFIVGIGNDKLSIAQFKKSIYD